MATVFATLKHYCEENDKVMLPWPDRAMLGRKIARAYDNTKLTRRESLPRMHSLEPEGNCVVVEYPDKFIPQIKEIIKKHYLEIPSKKRKRNAVKINPQDFINY